MTKNMTLDPFQTHQGIVPVTGNVPSFGFATFWSVKSAVWQLKDITEWAKGLPDIVVASLVPNELISSFERASNLESTRKIATQAITSDGEGTSAFFTTRKITSTERILLREVLSKTGKRLHILNVGTIRLDLSDTSSPSVVLDATWQQEQQLAQSDLDILAKEIENVVEIISSEVDTRSSGVEDQKIRTALSKWVTQNHGVSLRGHGGVYFIPHRQKDAIHARLTDEIKAIQNFLSTNDIGTIFAFEVVETPTFDKNDMISALLADINSELDPLLDDLDNNPDPKKRKLTSQISQVMLLREKVKALNETFNQRFTHVGIKLGVINNTLLAKLSDA